MAHADTGVYAAWMQSADFTAHLKDADALRELCKQKGLDKTGSKADMVARLSVPSGSLGTD